MARFTQTGTSTNGSTGAFVQLSSTWTGGSIPVFLYPAAAINYVIGDFASAALAASSGNVNVLSATTNLMFGPVDPTRMWIRSNGTAASIIYWDTVN